MKTKQKQALATLIQALTWADTYDLRPEGWKEDAKDNLITLLYAILLDYELATFSFEDELWQVLVQVADPDDAIWDFVHFEKDIEEVDEELVKEIFKGLNAALNPYIGQVYTKEIGEKVKQEISKVIRDFQE